MTDANRNLVVRIVTAVVLLPVVLGMLWAGVWPTAALISVACALLAFELYCIVFKKLDVGHILGIVAAAITPLAYTAWPGQFAPGAIMAAAFLFIGFACFYLIAGPLPEAPVRICVAFAGVFYCGLLLTGICGLRRLDQGFGWIILALAVTWLNDTTAYAAGRCFGKHKLYPAVSPGKTWEGAAGGLAGALLGAFLVRLVLLPSLGFIDCLLIAIPTSILGPVGDLTESMFKRAYGVKDSGKSIPGHGGLLDRLDALLFNVPYIFLYAMLSG